VTSPSFPEPPSGYPQSPPVADAAPYPPPAPPPAYGHAPQPYGYVARRGGPPPEVRWGLGDVGWGLFLFFGGQVAFSVAALLVAVAIGGQDEVDRLTAGEVPLYALAMGIIGGWLGLIGWPLWCTYRKGQRSLAKDFGLRSNWGDVGWGALAGFGCLAMSVLMGVLWQVIVGDDAPTNGDFLDDAGSGVLVALLLFALIAVGTPIAEELFFRGLFMRSLGKRFNVKIAVGVSSLVFGLMHATAGTSIGGGLFIAFVTGLYGLVLALVVVWRDGRLGAAITGHVVINGTQVIALFALGVGS
jgi:membrane protease YdiL (CAAX protease family)